MSELDKTIEQLEAEILEEMNDANAPKKSAKSPDKMQSVSGETEDLGEKPEAAASKMKKAAQPKTISASTEFDMEDAEELEEKKKMSMKEMEDEDEEDDEEEDMDEAMDMEDDEDEDEEDDEEEQEEMYDKKRMKKEHFEYVREAKYRPKKMRKKGKPESDWQKNMENYLAGEGGSSTLAIYKPDGTITLEVKPSLKFDVKAINFVDGLVKYKIDGLTHNRETYDKIKHTDKDGNTWEFNAIGSGKNQMYTIDIKPPIYKESFEDRLASIDVSEDVNALTEGHDLSEEFKEKASVIFEAAVKSKLREEIQRLEEEKEEQINEFVDGYKDELVEKVDKYLNYVVEQWMTENQLAVERGLKGEIAEDFIAGLKGLFEEHYIDVPNEKYDILESQAQQIEYLENKLNEQIQNSVELKNEVSKYIRESIFVEVSGDLSDTEKEKFESLVTETEYIDEESFRFKLNALKESYFPKTKTISESVDAQDTSVEDVEVSGSMAKYLQAISITKNKF